MYAGALGRTMINGIFEEWREWRNEALRRGIGRTLRAVGFAMRRELDAAIRGYAESQRALRTRIGVTDTTPVRRYDAEVRRSVEAFAAENPGTRFAYTSGSTSEPKKIAFTRERLNANKRGSLSVISRLTLARDVDDASLFIFAGLSEDDSLSSMLLDAGEAKVPFAHGLVMPASYLRVPALRALVAEYGANAARFFLLVLANPTILYSTNPSTLALFLTDVHDGWSSVTRLVRDYGHDPGRFDRALHCVVRNVASVGWRTRFAVVSRSPTPLAVAEYVPGVAYYCCWDGGYVRPFLDQLRRFLPADRYTLVPMYSMSTETVETLTYFDGPEVRFLPIAPNVLYEFLPEGAPDEPKHLVPAYALQAGQHYAMVVSDAYGLLRYQTDDLFLCKGHVGKVPDLRFVRRRGLTYSFTGEKLTDQHLTLAYASLREQFPALGDVGVQFTCIPSSPPGARVPFYRLVLAPPGATPPLDLGAVEKAFDAGLSRINSEYEGKRSTGRLGPPSAVMMPYDDLAARLDPKTVAGQEAQRGWDTQFKLLPLLTRLWEDHGFDTTD